MKIALIIIGVVLVIYLGISAYTAITVMKIPRIPLGDSPASVGLTYEDVSFPARIDNITLRGWYIPGGNRFTLIIVNGGWRNRSDPTLGTLELSKDLVEKGYSLLLFDLRGRGESEGEGLVLTHTDRDIGGAVDYIKGRGCSSQNIGIIGFSTGAASTIIFASQEDVAAVISDSSFADVTEMLVREVSKQKGLPELLVRSFTPGTFLMAKLIYGYNRVNPVDKVADVQCPILFIHGEIDESIPLTDAYELYQAGNNPSNAIWVVPNAGHCEGYKTDSVGYVEKVTTFLEGL